MGELPGKDILKDKIPSLEQYKKGPKEAISYTFMILFVVYLFWSEFMRKDDCNDRVALMERTLEAERINNEKINKMLTNRITDLENSLYVTTKALDNIGTKVGVKEAGNSQNAGGK